MLRRPRITLIRLLASIAVLALPMALYAPGLRREAGWRVAGALIAHCVESVAFLWLVLVPLGRSCLARWIGLRAGSGIPSTDRAARRRDEILLRFGPCLAVLLPVYGWGLGYRLPGFMGLGLLFLLLVGPCNLFVLIPLGLVFSPGLKRSEALLRSAATVALLALAFPCVRSIEPAEELGRRQLEHELGLARLARDCVAVMESRGHLRNDGLHSAAELESAAIRRLRPSYITVGPGELRIELHGGFAHHGYALTKDDPKGRWAFAWYDVEGGKSRSLLNWPIGADP